MSTTIEWTDETWNPTGGCDRISPGCAHCYAKTQWDMRHKAFLAGKKMAAQYAQPFEVVQMFPDRLLEPLSWRQPKRVFVNSVSDLFHEDVPFEFIDRVFATMAHAQRHTFQILTKRPERMREHFAVDRAELQDRWDAASDEWTHATVPEAFPLPNVWLGVSVENQKYADERIPLLLQTPAAVRFISAEPLLGPVDLSRYLHGHEEHGTPFSDPPARTVGGCIGWTPPLDWVIVGGESGPGARPFDLAWARSIVQQCKAAGVPCFVKQLGARPIEEWRDGPTPHRIRFHNRKGGEISEFPDDLKVRQFPEARP